LIARLRTRAGESVGAATDCLLDWLPDPAAATVDCGNSYFQGPQLSAVGENLLRLGGAVYCADRVIRRDATQDAWRREIELQLGVDDRDRWESVAEPLTEALEFLSGDGWTLAFRGSAGRIPQISDMAHELTGYDAVCLFSGGLDSMCGAIRLLEEEKRVALVGHFENGLAPRRQKRLARRIREAYGEDRAGLFQLRLGPAAQSSHQALPLPPGPQRESSFRARSMLFISAGMAFANALGPDVPLHVPENGFIGINVPLRPTRAGSLSTRTTHPWFIGRLGEALTGLGIANEIRNPFSLSTKGEVLAASADGLVAELLPVSLSCAHPESLYRFGFSPQHCGYCFPCLIRQASIHSAAIEDDTEYAFDVLNSPDFLDVGKGRAADLLAVLSALRRPVGRFDVLRNGPVSSGEVQGFDEVYRRGRDELRSWITARGSDQVRGEINE